MILGSSAEDPGMRKLFSVKKKPYLNFVHELKSSRRRLIYQVIFLLSALSICAHNQELQALGFTGGGH